MLRGPLGTAAGGRQGGLELQGAADQAAAKMPAPKKIQNTKHKLQKIPTVPSSWHDADSDLRGVYGAKWCELVLSLAWANCNLTAYTLAVDRQETAGNQQVGKKRQLAHAGTKRRPARLPASSSSIRQVPRNIAPKAHETANPIMALHTSDPQRPAGWLGWRGCCT